ncbi:hypothetical protein Fleli_2342 [Bernardetia litoralis DSM 6794]|uniref:Uncharacterized protein n=1 Tax=Bernardetia litoralis (strain ATCC 23117 / DSM 6794 / NBRC 15988 / NCIMB 1366 / Fx l1 / Sio-4) TaxID=880071 RepID=I4AL80_BERLS|nr:hypothetical protein [Bernardetia litoralis]AFM04715.1 hypothetical protein Fleli_2342 [Bernardetia litoralis DSM 6794]
MASSFIEIKDIGFWARDGFVEAMQLCLIDEIENQNLDKIEWISEFKSELALQSLPLVYGGMSMELEEFLTNDERKSQIIQLIDFIINKIDSTDNYITGNNLHELRKKAMIILSKNGNLEFNNQKEFDKAVNDSRWNEANGIADVKDRYLHSFKLLKLLINGEMKTTASSPENYWNYK